MIMGSESQRVAALVLDVMPCNLNLGQSIQDQRFPITAACRAKMPVQNEILTPL